MCIFSLIWIEYREIPRISLYSETMQENTNRENSEYGDFYTVKVIAEITLLPSDKVKIKGKTGHVTNGDSMNIYSYSIDSSRFGMQLSHY